MTFVLVDSTGASIDAYPDREAALRSYYELIERDPSAEEDVAVLAVDDDGVARERLDAPAESAAVLH